MSYIGPAKEFKKYLLECAVRKGYGWNEKTILLSDGASLIRNMGEELFPDVLQIRDFYHMAEHLYSFGKYLFGGDEARYTLWAEELIGLLRESKPGEVLKRLEGYKDWKLPPGTVNLYTYMQHNRNKVDYGEYKRRWYYIGSGPIESANKSVVQKRCKQAEWNERDAHGTDGSAIC